MESEAVNNARVLLVPGFGEDRGHLSHIIEALEASGVRSHIQSPQDISKLWASHEEFEQFHAVSHSLGAVSLLDAAIVNPERFSSLTLMQPMGFNPDSFTHLTLRTGIKFANNQSIALKQLFGKLTGSWCDESTADIAADPDSWVITRNQIRSIINVTRNPLVAIRDILIGIQADIHEKIKTARTLNIPVSIILAAADELFDANVAHQNCQSLTEIGVSYSWLADQKARHDTFWLQPNRTARAIIQIIASSGHAVLSPSSVANDAGYQATR